MSKRVDFRANEDDLRCALLGAMGFSTAYIEQQTGLSAGQIVYRLNKAQVKRTDYRDGHGKVAKLVLRATMTTVQQRLENYYSQLRRLSAPSST